MSIHTLPVRMFHRRSRSNKNNGSPRAHAAGTTCTSRTGFERSSVFLFLGLAVLTTWLQYQYLLSWKLLLLEDDSIMQLNNSLTVLEETNNDEKHGPLLPSSGRFHSETFASAPYSSHLGRRLVLVPLSEAGAYNACNDKILHLSCVKTIILTRTITQRSVVPVVNQLYPQFCKAVFEKQVEKLFYEEKGSRPQQIDRAEASLCLQTGRTVGALVETIVEEKASDEDGKVVTKVVNEHIVRHLLAKDAHFIAATLLGVNKSSSYRIVDRASIVMTQTYLPFSRDHNEWRRKDGNRGNFIWQYGATRMINPYTTQIFRKDELEWLQKKNFSALVLADANGLDLDDKKSVSSRVGMRGLYDLVVKVNAPTIFLGIGIQKSFEGSASSTPNTSTTNDAFDYRLFDHQIKMLKEIEKHQTSPAIAVRGELTKRTCENSGITHCVALGCPSLAISTEPNLGAKLESNWKALLERVSRNERIKLGITIPKRIPTGEHQAVLEQLMRIAQQHESSIVLQTRNDPQLLEAVNETSANNRVIFDNVEEWLNFTASCDLVLTPRIHSGMASLVSATPVVVISMDHRIDELVNAMLIPKLSLPEFQNAVSKSGNILNNVLRSLRVDFALFEENRRKRLASYVKILNQVGLEMNPSLLNIVHLSKTEAQKW